MRKIKMSDKDLTAALSKAPDWKSARRRALLDPIVEGPGYLPGSPDAIVKIKGRLYVVDIKTASPDQPLSQMEYYKDIDFKKGPVKPAWVVRWEEEGPAALAKLAAPAVYVITRERRFRTLKARDAWVQLISEKPSFIRFTGFEEPEDDEPIVVDESDKICPCGDPDCSRPFGHHQEET
jgi:hypothetical protein